MLPQVPITIYFSMAKLHVKIHPFRVLVRPSVTLSFFFHAQPRHSEVKWGMVEEDWYTKAMEPVVSYLRSFALVARSEYFTQNPKLLETRGCKGQGV